MNDREKQKLPQSLSLVGNTDLIVKVGARHQQVPSGSYLARVVSIDKVTTGRNRVAFHFMFEIVVGDYKGERLRGFANANYESFSSFTKLYRWFQAVTKDSPDEGDKMNLTLFHEKVLKVEVQCGKKSKRTQNLFSNVTEITGVHCDL